MNTILELGTDRYDPNRKSIHHDHYAPHGVELHAVECEVTDKLRHVGNDEDYLAASSIFAEFLMDFYESALGERGYSLRIDILMAFDLEQLVAVPEGASMGYAFKYPDRKQEALLGVVNILRAGEVFG